MTSTCSLTCPTYYYRVGSPSNTCSKCDSGCRICDILANNCTACITGYYLTGYTCATTCGSHLYKDTTYNKCASCNVACGNCNGPNSDNCLTCSTPYFLTGSTCTLTCPTGYYGDTLNCVKCPDNCASCTSANVCTSCTTPYYLKNEKICVSDCSADSLTNEYGDSSDNLCKTCASECLLCFGTSNSNCTSCTSTNFLISESNTCTQYCPTGYYGESSSSKCKSCNSNCTQCTSADVCVRCKSGYYYNSTLKICDVKCYDGYYADDSLGYGVCTECN